MKGVFVTGTGTGVGKSIVSAAIVSRLVADGIRAAAFKPVVTGLDEPDESWPMDHELLASTTGWQAQSGVTPYTYGPAVSPHLAAQLADERIESERLMAAFVDLAESSEAVVCEGVGGLLVPLAEDPNYSVLDLMIALDLPVVVAAHPDLGTISDTRLTVDRARAEGLEVRAVVLSGWPSEPTVIQLSNRSTLEQLLGLPVHTLAITNPNSIAEAAADLPAAEWIG